MTRDVADFVQSLRAWLGLAPIPFLVPRVVDAEWEHELQRRTRERNRVYKQRSRQREQAMHVSAE